MIKQLIIIETLIDRLINFGSKYTLPPGPEREVIETQLGYRWIQHDEQGR
jgi:hypothetical protein